jgi:hypothetical protein
VQVNGVQDLAGNANAAVNSTFDTAAAADTTAPQVQLVTPGDGATDIGPNAPVVVTFTESLNPATVNDSTFALFAGGYQLGAEVSRSADGRTVTLTTPLPPASVVTVVVTNAVTDLAGNRLANFLSQFTTAPALDLGRPSVVNQRPGNGVYAAPLGAGIVLFVSEPLIPSTVNTALRIIQDGVLVEGTIQVSGNGQTIQFVPSVPWTPNAMIQVFMDSTAQDLAGNALNNYQGSFRTAQDFSTSPPYVVRTSQSHTGVPLNPVIEVEYSEALDPATVTASSVNFVTYNTGVQIPDSVSLRNGNVIRIVPNAPLSPNTAYYYQIFGIRDLSGQQANSYFQSFTTGTAEDTVKPLVLSVTPPDGTGQVGVNAGVRLRFNEPVNPVSVSTATLRVSTGTGTPVEGTFSFTNEDRDVLLIPHAPLPDAATVTVAISGVEDRAGNVMVERTTQFGTRIGPDTVSPVVVRVNPFYGAVDVPVNAVITMEATEALDPSTVNTNTFFVYDQAGGQVPGSYNVSPDGRTVSFVPEVAFAAGRSYSVYLSARGMMDLSGNSLVGPDFSFTTAFAADTVGPQVIRVSPAEGLIEVPINAQVMVEFNEPIQLFSANQVTLSAGGTNIAVIPSFSNGNRTLTLTPTLPLAPLRVHSLTIGAVKDLAGNPLILSATTTFTTGTGADLISPSVTQSIPAADIQGVPTNSPIQLQFSERMNPLTFDSSTFRVIAGATGNPVEATIAVSPDGLTATLTPASPLAPFANYVIEASGVADLAGRSLFFSSSFSTGP